MTPAALALSRRAISSSKFFGSVPPIFSITALFTQIQFTEWMLTGTAPHFPSLVVNFCRAVGTTLAQSPFCASGVMSASFPSSA